MEDLVGKSGRRYDPLPIDARLGLPQSCSFRVGEGNYRLRLYADIDAALVEGTGTLLFLPTATAFMVARVERVDPSGDDEIIFLRKVVPEQEYETENIALIFPMQILATNNLNGQGDFGSQVVGGIAPRWA